MDTTTQECKKCGFETDCIEGICLECRLKMIDSNSKSVLHILNGIWSDITDREGIGNELYCCDYDIKNEIYEDWRKIVIEGLEMFSLEKTD